LINGLNVIRKRLSKINSLEEVIQMTKKEEFLAQLKEVDRQIEQLEELREEIFFRLDELK